MLLRKDLHVHLGMGDVAFIKEYREEHYADITPLSSPSPPPDDTDDTVDTDDLTDLDYHPPEPRRQRYTSTRRDESDLAKAMDELNMVLMYIHGTTPEVAAERRQRKIEQEERAAQEASRTKVMEWGNHLDVY
ncbi:hypothetical protein BC827DRAFT_836578 [Russula dissimulans]|nr:hypothetical protein BC827DRAFT_836578 [Russula dissimulans]